ncbi:hypothetical protein [Sphingomonas sp. R86521]|uniref:hypothetical protein n=1 Tax=Sphingomonas sp. R86521 TaxID=3093860 RepID=UPI0036D37DF2
MRTSAIAISMLLLSTVASSAQDLVADQDIVVIGQRMRLVTLDYALNGPHLRRCDILVSSGNTRVDGIMCAVLRRCITAGYREPLAAKRCMNASIDLFVSGKRRPPEPDPIGATVPPPRSPTLAPKTAYTTPATQPSAEPNIVVEGNRQMPTGGQWRFTKLESAGNGHLTQLRWGRCIPEGGLERMVRLMLNGEETRNSDGRCGPMKLSFKIGSVKGERTCLSSGSRMKTLVRGSFSRDRVLADETTYLVASLRQHQDDEVRVPENDSVAKMYGERIGECSASDLMSESGR